MFEKELEEMKIAAELARNEILKIYENVFIKNKKEIETKQDFTRGHFKRGIK